MEVMLDKVVFDTVPPVITRGTESKEYDRGTETDTLTVTVHIADSSRAINCLADDDASLCFCAEPDTVTAKTAGWKNLSSAINGSNTEFLLT